MQQPPNEPSSVNDKAPGRDAVEGAPPTDAPPKAAGLPAQVLATLINSREQEFARVSRLLHDEVGQVLSAVGLHLDVMRMDFSGSIPEIAGRTTEIQQLLERAMSLIRELSYELNPAIVERAGLPFAMERLVSRCRDTFGGAIRLQIDQPVRVPKDVANVFYKIAEFALENVLHHSEASRAEVIIYSRKDTVRLEIRDNGKGFPVPERPELSGGLGLLMMSHYARQAGVSFEIRSALGQGATVAAAYRDERKSK